MKSKAYHQKYDHSVKKHEMQKLKTIALVGNPNTGKSVIFHNITGSYVTVSNYPGTTVEVTRGKGTIEDQKFEVIDTPGIYSLLPLTEDERVARSILLQERPDCIIQLIDTKNLERMLPLVLQLIETGLPVILDLNMMDEAEKLEIRIDIAKLEKKLGIPIISTVATSGRGMKTLKETILSYKKIFQQIPIRYHAYIESSLQVISDLLTSRYVLSKRAIGLLLLQDDHEIWNLIETNEEKNLTLVKKTVNETKQRFNHPLNYIINKKRQNESKKIASITMTSPSLSRYTLEERLSRLMMRPITGVPILFLILYFGLYQFVGVFGAQILVDFLEKTVFEGYINPFIIDVFSTYVPFTLIQDLFVGEYGIITLGIRYTFAIIFPIVATFFIIFSIIEDSGYLPRMALLIDRVFKKIGLNGRAVIPMTLGLGCGTMATIVTRTLETRRERIIATFLLALAVPCSAQIGVLLGILAHNPLATLIWVLVLLLIFLLIGFLTAKIMPGERPSFYMEIPPLRRPKLSNILVKTVARLEWYIKEVFPIFILASILIWLGQITGIFDLIVHSLAYPVRWIGLPDETAVPFLFGFFRRDYGAAGLYDLQRSGILSGVSLVVAAVTLTLFVPCIAHFSVSVKERGLRTAFTMALFIFPFAFFIGFLLNITLSIWGVQL